MWRLSSYPKKEKKVIIKIVNLQQLERRSIVKDDDLEGRGIRSSHKLRRLNHYKLIDLSLLPLLVT